MKGFRTDGESHPVDILEINHENLDDGSDDIYQGSGMGELTASKYGKNESNHAT